MTAQDIETIGKAEIVIGVVPPVADSARLVDGISRIAHMPMPDRAILIHPPFGAHLNPSLNGSNWILVEEPRLAQDRSALAQSIGQSFRHIFDVAGKLDVKACAVIASDLSSVTPEWISQLIGPVVRGGMDLVTPCYDNSPYDGLINRAVVYPMVRALYGRRVRNPMGPDVALSRRLIARMGSEMRPRLHPLVSLVAESIATEMKICQTHLGTRVYANVDWTNVGPSVSQVLAALFLDVERFAPWWQRARGSEAIQDFGCLTAAHSSEPPFNPEVLIQRFQIGARGLIETWGAVLPPSTLVTLRRLAQQGASSFRMPDDMWARIVYDFALAHRVRPASREQTLRGFAPIYLGWAASYALAIAKASPQAVEQRLEELCGAFEMNKSYFVSRWRWPDRFNP